MNSSGMISRALGLSLGAVVALVATGCGNFFVAKHKVLVDAISASGTAKPAGISYRLIAKKSVVTNTAAQVSVIKACIDAAMATKGLFEAPANVPPDYFIEVAYGVDQTPRVDASARETFLQLSARSNPERSLDRSTGPEVWDVRVAVLGVAGRMETAMPLLSAVAVEYMGTDTKLETKVEIPQNLPVIAAVRESAIKALESKAGVAQAGAGAEAGAGPSAGAAANASVTPVKTR